MIFLLLFNIFNVFGQTPQSGFSLHWDSEVGCLNYSDQARKSIPLEDIDDSHCLLVCAGSTVKFHLLYNDQQLDVLSIDWIAIGGNVNVLNGGKSASIYWPNALDNGSVQIHITLKNGENIYTELCVKAEPKPTALFNILAGDKNNNFFCSHADIYFQNTSTAPDGVQIVAQQWDFGDGSYSNANNPVHSYAQSGIYYVTLTIYDECGCSDVHKIKIQVLDPGLKIECPTVACEGSIQTYTVVGTPYTSGNVHCAKYIWNVDGGVIESQNNDWVEVNWNNVGPDGYGYLYFDQNSCNVTCRDILAVRIPVIAKEGVIRGGKTKMCQGEQSRYSLPQWPTTDFQWMVYDDAHNAYPDATILVDQRNEIVVDASYLPGGKYTLSANYTNTLLKCGGQAEFNFEVLANLQIDENHSPSVLCEGDNGVFHLMTVVSNATWTLDKQGQTLGTGNGSSFTYNFHDPGYYTVRVTAPHHCADITHVQVYEIPYVTGSDIQGPDEICPGRAVDYNFTGDTNGFDVQRQVVHGIFLGPEEGPDVSVNFGDGYSSYQIKVRLVNPDLSSCKTPWITKTIQLYSPNVDILSISSGSAADHQDFCTSSTSNFKLHDNTGNYSAGYYDWSIVPAELAHVSTGQGTDQVNIVFNEPYNGQNQGSIIVKAKVCGIMQTIETMAFDLIESPTLTILNAPTDICPNTPFNITVQSSMPLGSFNPQQVSLSFDNGTFSYNNITLSNPDQFTIQGISLGNGSPYQNINVAYSVGYSGSSCGSATVSGSLLRHPAPVFNVSHTGANVFCHANDINTVLTASVQGVGVQANDVKWYKGNGSNPIATGPTLDLGSVNTGFGSYYAVATNSYGCTTVSNSLMISQDCATPPPPCTGVTVTHNSDWIGCDEFKLTLNYPGNPAVSFWKVVGITDQHATFTTHTQGNGTYTQFVNADKEGHYIFLYVLDYGNCQFSDTIQVTKAYSADLDKGISCTSNGWDITLHNNSQVVPNYNNASVTYTIKDMNNNITVYSLQQGTADPNWNQTGTTIAQSGDYKFILTVQGAGDPACTITQTFHLQKPDASFTLSHGTGPYCHGDTVLLAPNNPTPGATYLWSYQGATNHLQTLSPTLNGTAGQNDATIKLKVTGPYGCVAMDSITGVIVKDPHFQGKLKASPNTKICPNGIVQLNYLNLQGTMPSGYQWYHESSLIFGATGQSLTAAQPGEYAVYLYGPNGCVDASLESIYINEVPPPHVTVSAPEKICEGDVFHVIGDISPGTVQYRIKKGSAVVQNWTGGPSVNYQESGLSQGTYTYLLEYTFGDNHQCTGSESYTVKVFPQSTVNITYDVVTCDPFKVKLTADAGGQPGAFLWSTGQTGTTIVMTHGGEVRVRFLPANNPCGATDQVTVPKPPEQFSWIFPEGCFSFCISKNYPYVIGPLAVFDSYVWDLDGVTQTNGTGQVPPYYIDSSGDLTLSMTNDNCTVTPDTLHITQGAKCAADCNIKFEINNITAVQNGAFAEYDLFGVLHNDYGFPITVELNTNAGIFLQSPFYLSTAQTINFTANNPLVFIPNNGFAGGSAQVDVIGRAHPESGMKIICHEVHNLQFPGLPLPFNKTTGYVEMSVTPNPSPSDISVTYKVKTTQPFDKGTLSLYGLSGNLLETRILRKSEGTETFNLTRLSSGTYILVFLEHGRQLGQEIVIKK